MKRVLTALVALPILLYATWSAQPYLFYAIAAFAILAALHEFYFIAEKAGAPAFKVIGFGAAAAIVCAAAFGRPDANVAIVAAMTVLLAASTLVRVEDKTRILVSAGATAYGVLYVAFLGSFLVAVRAIERPGMAPRLLTLYFAIIMLSDTGAYYTGRAFGKHKLAPRVSPAKTIEGSVGGFVTSTAGAVAAKYIFFNELPLLDAVGLGACLGLVGQVGDLCESLLKRGSDVKDAASILPGHGGFLDRLDSMLPTAPLLYYYYVYVLAPRL